MHEVLVASRRSRNLPVLRGEQGCLPWVLNPNMGIRVYMANDG